MTIAQQLKITEFPFEIRDSKGRLIYAEESNGFWVKREWGLDGHVFYYESSFGTKIDTRPKSSIQKIIEPLRKKWLSMTKKQSSNKKTTIARQLNSKEFPLIIKDSKGNEIYYENSYGFWTRYEYDSDGDVINYKIGGR
jgi:hypothetical protein